MTNDPVGRSTRRSDAGQRSTERIVRAFLLVLLVVAIGFVAFQVLPPTGPSYQVGMCLNGDVSSGEEDVAVVPCDQPHRYVVVKIIAPAVTQSHEICPSPYAGYISFEPVGLEQKLRHVLGDQRVEAQFACLQASG